MGYVTCDLFRSSTAYFAVVVLGKVCPSYPLLATKRCCMLRLSISLYARLEKQWSLSPWSSDYLPKAPSCDAFYLCQLWVHNFGIHSAKNKTGHFFMYDHLKNTAVLCSCLFLLRWSVVNVDWTFLPRRRLRRSGATNVASYCAKSALVWTKLRCKSCNSLLAIL